MKVRESGMPDEHVWEGFFDPAHTLQALDLNESVGDVVEFGCGYGTFTIPAAKLIAGHVQAIDIEPDMIEATRRKAEEAGVSNIQYHLRDFVLDGTGLPDNCADYVMLLNILHADNPQGLLREAHRILRERGKVAVIHWNYDSATPRGPPMEIRPKPEQCCSWAEAGGFILSKRCVGLPPYHFGIVGEKRSGR